MNKKKHEKTWKCDKFLKPELKISLINTLSFLPKFRLFSMITMKFILFILKVLPVVVQAVKYVYNIIAWICSSQFERTIYVYFVEAKWSFVGHVLSKPDITSARLRLKKVSFRSENNFYPTNTIDFVHLFWKAVSAVTNTAIYFISFTIVCVKLATRNVVCKSAGQR